MAEFNMKEYALQYVRLGLSVFPLKPGGKEPLTAHGCKDASKDSEQVTVWWDRYPSANIGIATGKPSGGLLVIDLDVGKDKGIDGRETLREWERKRGKLPENTWLAITGRGGYHYFYRDSSGNRNKAGLYEGIDIRGDGGYIVAPPSIHPNGRRYEWERPPWIYSLAAADSKVNEFLHPVPESWERKSFSLPAQIPEGGRVNAMVKLVCSQQGKGLSDEAIRAAVRAENEAKCVPPLTDQELEKEVFPALRRYQKGTAPYTAVYDKGKFRQVRGQREKVSLICMGDVEEEEITWLYQPYVPRGNVTICAAYPGTGKTFLLCYMAACVRSEEHTSELQSPY